MKKILTVLSIFISIITYAQVDTCLTKDQIKKIGTTINGLNKKVEICDGVIKEYFYLEQLHSEMMKTDSIIIFTQKSEIGMLKISNANLQNSLTKTKRVKNIFLGVLIASAITSFSVWRF
jgi:hypothetical protein